MSKNIITFNTSTIKPSLGEVVNLTNKLKSKGVISEELIRTEQFDGESSQMWGGVGSGAAIVFNVTNRRLHVVGTQSQITSVLREMRIAWGSKTAALLEDTALTELSEEDGEYVEDEERRVVLSKLNPDVWTDGRMKPEVARSLVLAADNFIELLQIDKGDLIDMTLTGSNANYTWNEFSDFDIHLVVDMKAMKKKYGEVFPTFAEVARKLWNNTRDVTINGYEVEVYVEDAEEVHDSTGIYSLIDADWVVMPKTIEAMVDDERIEKRVEEYKKEIESILSLSPTEASIRKFLDKLVRVRKAGLASGGEMHEDNLIFKELRNRGELDKLNDALDDIRDGAMSVPEDGDD